MYLMKIPRRSFFFFFFPIKRMNEPSKARMMKEKQNSFLLLVVLAAFTAGPEEKRWCWRTFQFLLQLQKLACSDLLCFGGLHTKMPTILLSPLCEINTAQKFLRCLHLINGVCVHFSFYAESLGNSDRTGEIYEMNQFSIQLVLLTKRTENCPQVNVILVHPAGASSFPNGGHDSWLCLGDQQQMNSALT